MPITIKLVKTGEKEKKQNKQKKNLKAAEGQGEHFQNKRTKTRMTAGFSFGNEAGEESV